MAFAVQIERPALGGCLGLEKLMRMNENEMTAQGDLGEWLQIRGRSLDKWCQWVLRMWAIGTGHRWG